MEIVTLGKRQTERTPALCREGRGWTTNLRTGLAHTPLSRPPSRRHGLRHHAHRYQLRNNVTPAIYLRAAQAYMLISMPTGTSTIFGAFQAIVLSFKGLRDVSVLSIKLPRHEKFASGIFCFDRSGSIFADAKAGPEFDVAAVK